MSAAGNPFQRAGLRVGVKWVQRIFAPAALVFLLYFAWHSRDVYGALMLRARADYLLAALLCWSVLHLSVSPLCSARLMQACGASIGFQPALRIHTRNLPARYLPGGIWHTVGRISDFHLRGVNAAQIGSFVFLENTLAAGVALTMGGFSVAYFRGLAGWGWGTAGVLGALGGLALLFIAPLIANLKKLKLLQPVDLVDYAMAMAWAILFWIVAGSSFVCYLLAFPFSPHAFSFAQAGGGYLFSWGVGFISIFSPQGIGVSEAVMASILPSQLPFGGMLTLAAGFRIVIFGADALAWVLSLAIAAKSKEP